ncbi:MAG: metal ABC transporter substrate-binding protein [Oscillospiraceae bacterium]|nr:metal ABC transporter substrate-binding protein [Oscillospiraceae bacterium]
MKKICVLILICLLCGCSTSESRSNDKLQVIALIFPPYDFARQIAADKAEITMLLPPGMESHHYEPTPKDIINIENCDLFIYAGGESDEWVDEILKSMKKKIKVIRMIDCIDTKYEDEDGDDYDEHVWTSPVNAMKISEKIKDVLIEIDSENKDFYQANYESYLLKLEELDNKFRNLFVNKRTLVFADRFPFRYFIEEYRLNYYSALPGCNSEMEPSAATMAFLINKIKEENINTIYYLEFSTRKIADTLAETTGVNTAMLHSCHNVSYEDLENGATYLSLMERNYETLAN